MWRVVPGRVLVVSVLLITASTQPVFLLGASFFDIGPEFGFGPTGLGALTAVFFVTAALASVPLGRVVERIGWRTAMRLNAAGSAIAAAAIAAFADSTETLAALLVFAGVWYGFGNPAANQALAERVDPAHRAFLFGLKHAGIPSSTLLAGLAVPLVVVTLDWRAAYVLAALLAVAVLAAVPRRDGTEEVRALTDPQRPVRPLSTAGLALLSLGAALATWAAIGLGSYLVAAAVDVGFSESVAGLLLFAGSAASIAGRVAAGLVADRRHSSGFAGVAVLMGLGAPVFVALAGANGAAFAGLVVAAFATGWAWPGLLTYSVVNANTGSAAASSGVTQAGIFVGAGVGPLLIGWVIDRSGFDAAWLVVAAALALAAAVVAAVGRSVRLPLDFKHA